MRPDIAAIALPFEPAVAHSGDLDSYGCHAGSQLYHCHRPATPAEAQSRPFGTSSDSDLRTTLGDCPVNALRAAWDEMDALEAVAVETEVLRLCTDRAEAINRLLAR